MSHGQWGPGEESPNDTWAALRTHALQAAERPWGVSIPWAAPQIAKALGSEARDGGLRLPPRRLVSRRARFGIEPYSNPAAATAVGVSLAAQAASFTVAARRGSCQSHSAA